MRMSPLALAQQARAHERDKQAAAAVTDMAVAIYRAGLTETLGAKEGEDFKDALHRVIDERIAAKRIPRWKFWA